MKKTNYKYLSIYALVFLLIIFSKANAQLPYKADLILPDTVYVAVDREISIWWDGLSNITESDKEFYFNVNVTPNTVMYNKNRCLRFLPTTTGNYPVTIDALDRSVNKVATVSSVITAVSKTNGSGTKYLLMIGDSRLSNGRIVTTLKNCFTTDNSGMAISFVGTQGSTGEKNEGRSGWSIATNPNSFTRLDTINPFWNGFTNSLHFQDYITSNSLTAPDIVYICLGINDIIGYKTRLTRASMQTYIDAYNTLISAIRNASTGYPSARIIIGLEPYYSDSDGMSANYYTDFCLPAYKYNMRLLWTMLIETFKDTYNVRFSINGICMDRMNSYPYSIYNASQIDKYNKYSEFTNGVHSNPLGYDYEAIQLYAVCRSFY